MNSTSIGLRGTWTKYYSDNGFYHHITITKHYANLSPYVHKRHITVYKRGYHDYWIVPSNGQGIEVYYAHDVINNREVVRIDFSAGVTNTSTDAYYKVTSHKFRTANNTNFFYNTWSPAYLDMDSDGADLYSTYEDAKNEENSVTTFSNSRKQIEAKWISKTQQDNVLKLKIDGQIYYENNNEHDIRPYSVHRDSDGIWSNLSPTSPYARLKKGTHIYKGTKWTYFYNDSGGNKTYQYNGSKWEFEY